MSKLRKNYMFLAVVMILSFVSTAKAQQEGMNLISPYTMYGFGHMNLLGTSVNRSMAGTGVAIKNPIYSNMINPAALSAAPRQSFLFSFGMQGNNDYIESASSKTSSNKFNIGELAFQFPIANKLGFGISLNPYSYVGYDVSAQGTNEDMISSIGPYEHTYQGSGGITLLKAGIGWEPVQGLSVGASLLYYHSSIDRISSTTINPIFQPTTDYRNIQMSSLNYFSKLNFEVGAIYALRLSKLRTVNFGFTYQPKISFNENVDYTIGSYSSASGASDYVTDETYENEMVFPAKISVGTSYNTSKIIIAADYIFQDFTSAYELPTGNSIATLTNYQDIRLGVSYTPSRYDIRSAIKRWTYRAGVRYGNSYLAINNNKITDYSVTLGAGIPLQRNSPSHLNIGFDVGQRGSVAKTNFKETYFKVSIGVNFFVLNEWFVRHKFK